MLSRSLQQHKQQQEAEVSTEAEPLRRNALQPSSITAVNAANPLKRKAGGYGMSAPKSLPIGGTGSVLNVLHGSVYFDENDFVDDSEINLDEDSPLPTIKPAKPTLTQNDLPPPVQTNSVKYPSLSTSQIEWPSSPLSHKRTPPQRNGLKTGPEATHLQGTALPAQSEIEPTPPPRRRNLPWLSDGAEKEQSGSAQDSRFKRRRHDAEGVVSYPVLPESTPQTKIRNDTSFLWNKTASAVKEAQKQHRQAIELEKKQAKGTEDVQTAQPEAVKTKSTKTSAQKPAKVFLSEEQRRVLDLIEHNKKSVFFTGSAGTGKSVLMREIIHVLKRKFAREGDRVAVTASTGLAACNIGGVTLHSFSGIGLGKEPVEELVKRIKKNSKARHRWLRCKVLIIDEISMVDGVLFDKLEEIARIIRSNGRPFGGIQLVITGDFFQLPPVPERGQVAKFAFEAATWSTSIHNTIGLTQVFRQKDPEFAGMLNDMRLGKLTTQSIAKFRALTRKPLVNDGIEITELFPTRLEVDKANETRLRSLPGNTVEFVAMDGGSMTDHQKRTDLLQNCLAAEKISLKVGSQVMLIKNIDETLVNGSIGKVVGFMDEKTYDFTRGHDVENPEVPDGSEDEGFAKFRLKVKGAAAGLLANSTAQKWPLVEFPHADGTSRELLCVRESWKVELPNGEVVASRAQVPLILAWALSIHKAQGQTLEKVRVDLGKIFERGQAYVALSRATTQEGLQILRFDPKKVMADDRVRTFYDSLSTFGEKKVAVSKSTTAARTSISRDDSLFLTDDEDAMAHARAHGF